MGANAGGKVCGVRNVVGLRRRRCVVESARGSCSEVRLSLRGCSSGALPGVLREARTHAHAFASHVGAQLPCAAKTISLDVEKSPCRFGRRPARPGRRGRPYARGGTRPSTDGRCGVSRWRRLDLPACSACRRRASARTAPAAWTSDRAPTAAKPLLTCTTRLQRVRARFEPFPSTVQRRGWTVRQLSDGRSCEMT